MDKLIYEEPVMEVVDIEMEDIITNSTDYKDPNELPVIPKQNQQLKQYRRRTICPSSVLFRENKK